VQDALIAANFWVLDQGERRLGLDGSDWLIEGFRPLRGPQDLPMAVVAATSANQNLGITGTYAVPIPKIALESYP
jgi:hypothetical protein